MVADGRLYQVEVIVVYTGGFISNDALDALTSALRGNLGPAPAHVGVTVSADRRSALNVRVTVRDSSPIKALARLDTSLDQALLAAGLFEEFDVTGKTLFATPDRERPDPPQRGGAGGRHA